MTLGAKKCQIFSPNSEAILNRQLLDTMNSKMKLACFGVKSSCYKKSLSKKWRITTKKSCKTLLLDCRSHLSKTFHLSCLQLIKKLRPQRLTMTSLILKNLRKHYKNRFTNSDKKQLKIYKIKILRRCKLSKS